MAQARAGNDLIKTLLAATGTQIEIASLGVKEAHVYQIAASSVKAASLVRNNPALITTKTVKALLLRAFVADRSWWQAP